MTAWTPCWGDGMKLTTRQLTLCAVLTALALALSYAENLLPLSLAIPLPGVKLGIARCTLGALFAGNVNALLFSLLGGLCAMGAMSLLSRFRHLSVYGVSVGGAATHNCGQVAAAILTLGNAAPLYYLSLLLGVSLFTGALTGFAAGLLFRALEHTSLMKA